MKKHSNKKKVVRYTVTRKQILNNLRDGIFERLEDRDLRRMSFDEIDEMFEDVYSTADDLIFQLQDKSAEALAPNKQGKFLFKRADIAERLADAKMELSDLDPMYKTPDDMNDRILAIERMLGEIVDDLTELR